MVSNVCRERCGAKGERNAHYASTEVMFLRFAFGYDFLEVVLFFEGTRVFRDRVGYQWNGVVCRRCRCGVSIFHDVEFAGMCRFKSGCRGVRFRCLQLRGRVCGVAAVVREVGEVGNVVVAIPVEVDGWLGRWVGQGICSDVLVGDLPGSAKVDFLGGR